MPVTNILFLLACLAISGIPPLSGFFSKEEILTAAFNSNKLIYGVGILTAALTAFYMFRLYYSIFWNTEHKHERAVHSPSPLEKGLGDEALAVHHPSLRLSALGGEKGLGDEALAAHSSPLERGRGEAPTSMLIALLILGIGTVAAGFIPFTHYITSDGKIFESEFHLNLAMIAVAAGVTGILIATVFYLKPNDRADKISIAWGGLYRSARNRFYVDEVYTFITKRIIFNLISAPAAWIDKNIVDRTMILSGEITSMLSDEIKTMQSGKVYDYVVYFFLGVLALSVLAVFY